MQIGEREVYWCGDIDEENMKEVTSQLLKIQASSPEEKITLYITSGGGDLQVAFAFYDLVKLRGLSLTTIALGRVESAAVFVLLSGKRRKATKHSIIALHLPHRTFEESACLSQKDFVSYLKGMIRLQDQMVNIISAETQFSREGAVSSLEAEQWFTAPEAQEIDFVHEIVHEIANS